MLVIPFVVSVSGLPVQTFYQEWSAFTLGCVAFIAIVAVPGKSSVEVPRMVLLPIGILLLLLAQMAMGKLAYWQQGAMAAMYLLWSVAMLCVGRTLRQQLGWEEFCRLAAWAICSGALLSALIGVMQLAGWHLGGLVAPLIGPRVHANLGQANHYAAYLCLGLVSLIYLACTRRLHVLLAGAACVLLIALANLSGSRSIWLYLASMVLLAVWTHRATRSTQTRTLVTWTAAAVASLLLLQMISGSLLERSALRHVTAGARLSVVDAASSHRLAEWLASLLMFKSAPITGVGFNGYGWNYFLLAGSLPAGIPEEITDHAHNLALQLLAEFGLPGAILAVGAALVWWVGRFREKASIHLWWMLSLVAIMSLHSLLEYPLWYAYFLGTFALLVGAGDRTGWRFAATASSRIVMAGLCIAMLWTLASVLFDYRRVERLGIVADAQSGQSDVRAEALRLSGASLFTDRVELGLSRIINLDGNEIDAKLELNGRVLRAYPDADVAYRQSALLALAGELTAAYRQWDLASAAYPSQAKPIADTLALRSSMGEARLEPLVEYAASRSGE